MKKLAFSNERKHWELDSSSWSVRERWQEYERLKRQLRWIHNSRTYERCIGIILDMLGL